MLEWVPKLETASGLEPEPLRLALERELGVPVSTADEAPANRAHLRIEAAGLDAVSVVFVRADTTAVERVVDVSSLRSQAVEALALLAANLVRDEAAELLAELQARAHPLPAVPDVVPVIAAPAPQPARAMPREPGGCDRRRHLHSVLFGADLFPYAGTNGPAAPQTQRTLSFNLFGGLIGAVRGAELGFLFNHDLEATCGAQIALGANLTAGPTRGLQLALYNQTNGQLEGVQYGLVSIVGGSLKGAQFALVNVGGRAITGAQFGLVNVSAGPLRGVQYGSINLTAGGTAGAQFGLGNLSAGDTQGAQFSLVNVSTGALDGVQSGLANVAVAGLHGAQLGLANTSVGGTHGAQVGLVNVSSGDVRGVQLGLVNVADDADAAVGLVSVMAHGRTHIDVWGTDAGLAMVGLEHGGRLIHNIYGLGVTAREHKAVFAAAFGLGARLFASSRVFVDLDALGYVLFREGTGRADLDNGYITQLRIPVGINLLPGFALFVSPSVNVSLSKREDNPLAFPSLLPAWRLTESTSNVGVELWPGVALGLRFF